MRMRETAVGAVAAFALNWIWENVQAPLYKGYAGFGQHVWTCTLATLGDVVIVALIFAAVAAAWGDPVWHRRGSLGQYCVAVLFGVATAVAIEYWALATNRWAYEGMPLAPYTRIGLLPIAQMILIPPLVFVWMRVCERDRRLARTDEVEDR